MRFGQAIARAATRQLALLRRAPSSAAALHSVGGGVAAPSLLAREAFGSHAAARAQRFSRGFAAAAAGASKKLGTALANELTYEKESYETEEDLKTAPGGYTLTEKPGDGYVSLTKSSDGEEITVAFEVNNQPDPEDFDDEEEGAKALRHFTVVIAKGDNAVTFECITDGDGTNIDHMTFGPKDGFDSDTMYTGPVFHEMDEDVTSACQNYLSERYIFDLGPWIHKFIADKEQRLYMEWLEATSTFFKN